jgi:hypothetical protein
MEMPTRRSGCLGAAMDGIFYVSWMNTPEVEMISSALFALISRRFQCVCLPIVYLRLNVIDWKGTRELKET